MPAFDFSESAEFTRNWSKLGLTDADLAKLQLRLMANPQEGRVIPGTGGHRKLRIRLPARGKRGGGRVIYIIFWAEQLIRLANVYAKNQ
jgi:hypothetical protein